MKKCIFLIIAMLNVFCGISSADLAMGSLFSNGMVLQRDTRVPIWGWADAGQEISVDFGGQHCSTTADSSGKWQIVLEPMKASSKPKKMEVSVDGVSTLKIKNVLIGEVWICSGQSNMAFPLYKALNAKKEIAAADFPLIRGFKVARSIATKPRDKFNGKWVSCKPDTVKDFSAVAFFLGRELFQDLNVPVGLIMTYWGGTPAQAWTPAEVIRSKKEYKSYIPILDRYIAYESGEIDKKVGGVKSRIATVMFNSMLAPAIPYAIRGVIWYQGESNTKKPHEYKMLFSDMICSWRERWKQGDFPFIFVQLPNYNPSKNKIKDAWAQLREAQMKTLSLPNTSMAVTIDLGEARDIHPKNKYDVGHRLALLALANVYGRKIESSGPIYRSMKVIDNKIQLSFDHVGDGLIAKNGKLKGFEICGEDKKFVPADVKIAENNVIVSSDKIEKPVAVRYGWANNPTCTLYNKNGLPASPFRTDNYKLQE